MVIRYSVLISFLVIITLGTYFTFFSNAARPAVHGPSWQSVGTIPPALRGNLTLQFANENRGWIADEKSLWATTDGGKNWSLACQDCAASGSDQSEPGDILGLRFIDTRSGVMLRGDAIYRTENGGTHWSHLAEGPVGSEEGSYSSMTFINDKKGWITGGFYSPVSPEKAQNLAKGEVIYLDRPYMIEGFIFYTEDGGLSWIRQSTPPVIGPVSFVSFYDEQHGQAFTLTGVLYTQDGGKRWVRSEFDKKCTDEKLWGKSADERYPISIYIKGEQGWLSYKDGYVAKSTDGGKTWCDWLQPEKTRFSRPYYFLTSIHFITDLNGFGLAGDSIYETKDGGKTWSLVPLNSPISSMHFLESGHGWAVGRDRLYKLNTP